MTDLQNNILIIIASDYPFGPGEPFLENEIKQIEGSFKKIIFLVTSPISRLNTQKLFYTPASSEIIHINKKLTLWNKLQGFRWFFQSIFWDELFFIKQKLHLRISIQILKVNLFALAKGIIFKKQLQFQLKKFILNPDYKCFFYSYWCTEHTLGLTFLKIKYPKIKVFSRAHGWDVYYERNNPPYLPYRRFIINNIDCLFTISENGKNYLQNKLSVPNKRLQISKLGVFYTQINNKENNETETLKILSLSYVNPVKRLLLLVDALSLLNIKICWTHIGGSGDFKNLVSYSNKKLLKPNITFDLKGNLSKAEIYNYFQNNYVDFLINTSYTEGIPVSMMEAMSFGIPVIGTNVGGVSEIIDDGENGFLMASDPTPEEIAQTILKFNSLGKNKYADFRLNAFNTWAKNYNAEKNYTLFLEQILSL